MYCSSCGTEVTQELNYCNRCGANLNPPANMVTQISGPPVKLTGPTIALGAMVVIGLGVILGSVDNLAMRGVHPTALAWIAIVSIAMVFGVAALFIRLWANLATNSSARAEQPSPAQLKQRANAQLPAAQTGPVNAPVASVTDHTTRTLEPAYRESSKRGS